MYREEDLYEEEGREHTCPHQDILVAVKRMATPHYPHSMSLKIRERSEEGKDAGGGRCGKACGWSRSPDD